MRVRRDDWTDLKTLLLAPGALPHIGAESGRRVRNGIARFRSAFGSTRYVLYEDGRAVSALQVVSRDGVHATIANVYTAPDRRRLGLAARLLRRAQKDFASVEHSTHLSDDGRAWKASVRDRRRRWRR